MSTPIRQQYLDIKARHPDTILFFRLGDFYETFDDDAKLVADELHITLTSKPMGKDVRIPLAGVPYHSIDSHVATLVARGYRVAICEQMADPAEVKGLVPREVVRVVTAGTLTAEASLSPEVPNYLAALAERSGTPGLAVADISTGEIILAAGNDVNAELLRCSPSELLVEDEAIAAEGISAPVRSRPMLDASIARVELARQFGEQAGTVLVEGDAEAVALAHLLRYVRETFPAALGSLQRIRQLAPQSTLAVDSRTLRNLDVLPTGDRGASLLRVLNRSRSAMGARALRRWLTRPSRDLCEINARHDAVAWVVAHPIEREQAQSAIHGVADIERLTARIGSRSIAPRELAALRAALRATLGLGAVLTRAPELPARLSEAVSALAAAADPLLTLDATLDDDPPSSFDEGGVIRAGFSPEIDSLRALTRDARGYLLGLERLERERTGIKSLKVGHNRVFGYYIEVSAANAALVPGHYQRRQTLVGAERYVTEELKEHESHLNGARERLVELEKRSFAQLVETLALGIAGLQAVGSAVATIDVVLALGEVALECAFVRPVMGADRLAVMGGRHPVVEAALGSGRFVANDCLLDEDCQVLILTGPNMSGKSTFLRQVALIALMAQAGSFVPAAAAELPLFDRIFTRIGAQDDLAAGQSTFMVEMVETAQILHQATPDSLVILDEVGRGTSTFDGMAIARAVVEFLHNRREVAARTLFATHYHELTTLAESLPRVRNVHVAVSEGDDGVVFEHRIAPGPSDRSYGVHVARLAGLPRAVVSRAEHLLTEFEAAPARRGSASEPPIQPSLFQAPSPLERQLGEMDIDGMTPIEAIQALYELRAAARRNQAE